MSQWANEWVSEYMHEWVNENEFMFERESWVSERVKWVDPGQKQQQCEVQIMWRAVKLVFNLAAAAGCIRQHRGSHYLLTPPLRSLSCGHTAASGVPWPHHSQCTWDFPPERERQNCELERARDRKGERQTGHRVGIERESKSFYHSLNKNEGLLTCSVMFQWRIINTSHDRTAQHTRWHFNSSWETATETNYDLSTAKVWQAADWPCTFNVLWLWNGVYHVTIAAMEHSQV